MVRVVVCSRVYYADNVAKSQPFILRLSPGLDARVSRLADQWHRSKAAVLESLADEAERCRRYPGVAFRGHESRRRAWVIGTSLDVWQIIRALQDFNGDVDRLVADGDLGRAEIILALAYQREFPDEIERAMAADRRDLAQLRGEYPFIESFLLQD